MSKRKQKQPTPSNARGLFLPMEAETIEALKEHCKTKKGGLHAWAVGALLREEMRERQERELRKSKTRYINITDGVESSEYVRRMRDDD